MVDDQLNRDAAKVEERICDGASSSYLDLEYLKMKGIAVEMYENPYLE